MSIYTAVLVGSMVLGDVSEPRSTRANEFEEWFQAASKGDLEIPDAVSRKGKSFRYVFVGGFRNERIPGYFVQNMAELRALGVNRGRIHVISPSSSRDSEANAEDVKSSFLEIAARGPEKLVVIAHSRGACDALAFARKCFVRGATGGSPLPHSGTVRRFGRGGSGRRRTGDGSPNGLETSNPRPPPGSTGAILGA